VEKARKTGFGYVIRKARQRKRSFAFIDGIVGTFKCSYLNFNNIFYLIFRE